MKLISKIVTGVALMAIAAGCTGAQLQTWSTANSVGGGVCEVVFLAADPTLAPLCTTAAAVSQAIEGLVAAQAAAASDSGAPGAAAPVKPLPISTFCIVVFWS